MYAISTPSRDIYVVCMEYYAGIGCDKSGIQLGLAICLSAKGLIIIMICLPILL